MIAKPTTVETQQVMCAKHGSSTASTNIIPITGHDTPGYAPTEDGSSTTSPATTRRFDAIHFDYAGQQWRMFKRSTKPDSNWWFYFERNKQRYGPWSMKTNAVKSATTRAKAYIDRMLAGEIEQIRGQKSARGFTTLGAIFAGIWQLDIDAARKSRQGYIWGTRFVFRLALDLKTDEDVDKLSASVIDRQHGELFFAKARAHAATLSTTAETNRFKRTARQAFAVCKALFSPLAVRSLERDLHLKLPDTVDEFRKAQKTSKFKAPRDSEFQIPDDTTLRRTFREWLKIGRTPDYVVCGGKCNSKKKHDPAPLNETARRNMFIALGLMISCGLRKGEVKQVRWNWFQSHQGRPLLCSGDVNQKNKRDVIRVRPLDPFWALMNSVIDRNGWRGSADEYCLAERPKIAGHSEQSPGLQFSRGGKSDRLYWPFWHAGLWLRSLGWNMQKSNHALRDCAASFVTMKFGLHRAQLFCRHSNITTTQSSYNRFISEDTMDDDKQLAWLKWAK